MTAVVTLNGTHNMMMREMQVRFLTTSIVSLLTQCERICNLINHTAHRMAILRNKIMGTFIGLIILCIAIDMIFGPRGMQILIGICLIFYALALLH